MLINKMYSEVPSLKRAVGRIVDQQSEDRVKWGWGNELNKSQFFVCGAKNIPSLISSKFDF